MRFSTPSEYVKAIKSEKVEYAEVNGGDFMPYAEDNSEVYSGSFSSRPVLKK